MKPLTFTMIGIFGVVAIAWGASTIGTWISRDIARTEAIRKAHRDAARFEFQFEQGIVTDRVTGCRYMMGGLFGSIRTPLLRADGQPDCGGK